MQYFIMLSEIEEAMQGAVDDVEFIDEIFKGLCRDCEELLDQKLKPGDDKRRKAVLSLTGWYADASDMLAKFLVWKGSNWRKKAVYNEGGADQHSEKYMLQLKSASELRKKIMLDSVAPLVDLPAGAARMTAVLNMCEEYEWIEEDVRQAKERGWLGEEVKDTEKNAGTKTLFEQSIQMVPGGYLCLKWLEESPGEEWTKWRIFKLDFGYKWISISRSSRD
jgi:hypothetical protein